jgi:hypothetical protein
MEFAPLIGKWRAEGHIPIEPPITISGEARIERLGEFIVFTATAEPAEVCPTASRSSVALPTESRSRCTTPMLAA